MPLYPDLAAAVEAAVAETDETTRVELRRLSPEVLRVVLAYYVGAWTSAIAVAPDFPAADAAFSAIVAVLVSLVVRKD